MTPLLEVLRENGEMNRQDATDAVIRKTGLTPQQVGVMHDTTGKSIQIARIDLDFFSEDD